MKQTFLLEGMGFVVGQSDQLPQDEDVESVSSVLSTSEICMLEAVRKADRFLVPYSEQEVCIVGKKSRQPVITRMVDLGLLDDTYAGITKILLSRSNSWAFNTFNLDVSTGGRSLSYLLVHLFQEYGFINYFKLDIVKVWHCFNLMEAAYHRHNPYHNSVHAADVTQAMHCFLQENKFANNLTPLEAMSSVIAAVAHDLDHPGVTQAFLVATSNHLVNLYHNSSVLENHHWRTAISCLSESRIFNHLERNIWHEIQKQIRSLILATDITRQKEFLGKFQNYLSTESLDMKNTHYRHFALQIALKCADLCNPCRPWAISQRWSYQVCQEFYRQGAYERQLKLPLTPTFDCSRTKVAKIQTDFFQFVVSPLFETWDQFLQTSLSSQLLENLQHNFTQWQQKIITVQQVNDTEVGRELPQIKIDSSSSSETFSSEKDMTVENQLLSIDSDIILKQHRSKSDSGLTPGLLSPKIHMETYSTEELHPSTTLLSLSSITNTVQLRQVYAATKVESHLICPTIFQPISPNAAEKDSNLTAVSPTTVEDCKKDICSNFINESSDNDSAQCSVNDSCIDGCCTPPTSTTPEKAQTLHVHRTKQRSHSLINDSEQLRHYSQKLQNRRASDFDYYLYNNLYAAACSTSTVPNKEALSQLQHDLEKRFSSLSSDKDTSNKSSTCGKDKRIISLTSPSLCSNKHCSRSSCICKTDLEKKIPSWCWHISRSFSAERPVRPTHDFDSPLPSGHGSSSNLNYSGHNRRRGSAPVTYSLNSEEKTSHISNFGNMECRGEHGSAINASSGRRWSIPTETANLQVGQSPTQLSESHYPHFLSTRRSSFGLLEPLLAVSAMDRENTFRSNNSSFPHNCCICSRYEQSDQTAQRQGGKCVSSSDSCLSSFSSAPETAQRRGSLPIDLYHSREKSAISTESSEPKSQQSFLLEHCCKHGPSDLLSVLIGPSVMLNTIHGISSKPVTDEWPNKISEDFLRRRSGGLEMLNSLRRLRTNDYMSVDMASKLNLRRQLLEAWAAWRVEEGKADPTVDLTPSISTLGQKLVYQPRRGSVPINVSLLSLSSGLSNSIHIKRTDSFSTILENTLSGEQTG